MSSRTASASTPQGERLAIEFLIDEPSFQPHHMPFIKNLATLGIDAKLRIVDPVQMQQRLKDFDFDLTIQRFGFSATPGDSLRNYFSSQVGRGEGLAKSRRHRRSGDRRPDRPRHRGEFAGRTDHRLPRARPADPRRPLLDSALVQGVALDRLLGYVRAAADQTALCSGRAGNVVARSAEGVQNRNPWLEAFQTHVRLHHPPPAVHDPDAARHHAGVVRAWCSSRPAGRWSA